MASTIETKELESIDLLKTHYYKTCYEDLKDEYLRILEEKDFSIISIDDNYNEIFAEKQRMSVTTKIIEHTPRETSIDFYINSDYLFGSYKKGVAFIQEVLFRLEKKFELKGISLRP